MFVLNLPNAVSLTRILAAPFLIWAALAEAPGVFLGLFAFMMVTDFLDGLLARALKQQTVTGSQLDTIGDILTALFVIPGGWILWSDTVREEAVFFLMVPVILGISGSVALIGHGHLPAYHTRSAKLATALAGVGAWLLFADLTPWLFRGAVVLLFASAVEEICITLILPKWHPNVPSVKQALRERAAALSGERGNPLSETLFEERVNALTHGLGAVAAVPVLVIMVVMAARLGDPWLVTGVSIFGASLLLMYSCSTLYHALPPSNAKYCFRIFDHISIFLLIAGTYMPFTLGPLRGPWGWSLFGAVWGLALAGILLKVFFTGRLRVVSVLVYIGMGWMVLIAFHPLLRAVSPMTVGLLAAGGVSYTSGTVIYASLRLKYHHSIWHLFVLLGSLFHVLAVFTLLHR